MVVYTILYICTYQLFIWLILQYCTDRLINVHNCIYKLHPWLSIFIYNQISPYLSILIYTSLYLSIIMNLSLSFYQSVYSYLSQYIYRYVYQYLYQYSFQYLHQYLCQPVYQSINLSTHPSIHPSNLSTCVPHQYIYIYISYNSLKQMYNMIDFNMSLA